VSSTFSLLLGELLSLLVDLLDKLTLVLGVEDLRLLTELQVLDLLFELLDGLAGAELHVPFELLNLVEQLVGIGVELVPLVLVLLDLLVELVARASRCSSWASSTFSRVFALRSSRLDARSEAIWFSSFRRSRSSPPGAFNELTLRSVLKIVLRKVHVVRLVHRLDIVLFDDFFFRYHFLSPSITAPAVASARCRASSRT